LYAVNSRLRALDHGRTFNDNPQRHRGRWV